MNDSKRLTQYELHQEFVRTLGPVVLWNSDFSSKPLEVNLARPNSVKLRVYVYNATFPPGGRTLGERKIQLIVPGQGRGERGNFDHSDGRIVLLVGYESDVDVFILWDAGTYRNFAYSMNVQVNPDTVFNAFAGNISLQSRQRRTPQTVDEIVVCCPRSLLREAITKRIQLSFERVLKEGT